MLAVHRQRPDPDALYRQAVVACADMVRALKVPDHAVQVAAIKVAIEMRDRLRLAIEAEVQNRAIEFGESQEES